MGTMVETIIVTATENSMMYSILIVCAKFDVKKENLYGLS